MKKVFLFIIFLSAIGVHAQDVAKIKQIDTLVMIINQQTNLKVQHDSIIQDHPEMGLNIKTYLTMASDSTEIKKYVNNVYTINVENGITKQMNSSTTFYFYQQKLIKVEEYVMESGKAKYIDWYYSEDKPLYYTLQYDKAEERAFFLLTTAKSMLQVLKK